MPEGRTGRIDEQDVAQTSSFENLVAYVGNIHNITSAAAKGAVKKQRNDPLTTVHARGVWL